MWGLHCSSRTCWPGGQQKKCARGSAWTGTMKKERQLNFHCTIKNNNARVSTYLWVCSPGWGLHHIDPHPSSIRLGRFRKHTGSGMFLAAGELRYDLHSPFCDSIHGLYL